MRIVRARRQAKTASGQSLVELALVLQLLMFTTLGALELGRGLHASMTISNAARDGARVGGDSAKTVDQAKAASVASAQPLAITTSDVAVTRSTTEITVVVSYEFNTVVPLVSEIWGGGALTIERTAIARVDPS